MSNHGNLTSSSPTVKCVTQPKMSHVVKTKFGQWVLLDHDVDVHDAESTSVQVLIISGGKTGEGMKDFEKKRALFSKRFGGNIK